ncbi:hypothetical protein [Spirilliplanes yamanashiensis]|uniref:Uncharacterized protein n=1 Tax=Spirilliplanes yamanashiensis TaxID=42233 RepID=A0A8J3Y944_9ACTN|nr:hypothetical protein [Spirilliplanes yamanashiensis]MDP9816021.1 hypothetical protein [Spirilliplanes yamanashiensis]GIJ04281.1 hypothetical protein Sya03_36330 [Spirilliplanes yamanashiensis]
MSAWVVAAGVAGALAGALITYAACRWAWHRPLAEARADARRGGQELHDERLERETVEVQWRDFADKAFRLDDLARDRDWRDVLWGALPAHEARRRSRR